MDYDDIIFGMLIMLVLICIFVFGYLWGKDINNKPKTIDTPYCTEPCSMYDSRPECEVGK